MASKRTLIKREAQIKTLNYLLEKAKLKVVEDSNEYIDDELRVLLQNILAKRKVVDKLNEEIIDTIDEEKITEEI